MSRARLAVALAALALAGCASSRRPAETPDGAALDVATSVRANAAQTAGAAAALAGPGVDAARVQQLWGDAAEAEDEVLRTVPAQAAGKGPLLAAAAAARAAAQALTVALRGDRVAGLAAAHAQLGRAQAQLGLVADALAPRLPDRTAALGRLREPLAR